MKSSKLRSGTGCRIRQSTFATDDGPIEAHLSIQLDGSGSFSEQLAKLEAAYRETLQGMGLAWESALFRRIFVSDVANQEAAVGDSSLACCTGSAPVAVSLIEQCPLPGGKIALWAWHLDDQGLDLERQETSSGISLSRGPLRHLWSTRGKLEAEALHLDVAGQTHAAFQAYIAELGRQGATLRDHVQRTWIFVPSIDRDYGAMTAARRELFLDEGLSPESHYLASTGIAGRHSECQQDVILEGYAIAGIHPEQVRYLTAPDHLGPTQVYGVTFERGVSIQYGDRRHVLISGTASIDPQGRICHLRDVMAQTRRAFANVEALLHEAGAGFEDLAQMIVYLRDPSDQPVVQAWLEEHFPEVPCVLVHAPVCRPGWLIEVECSAIVESRDSRWSPF